MTATMGETAAIYQFLPPLTSAELTQLRSSIQEHGVQVPILVDETGAVIDGHHRQRIAGELGIDCPRIVRAGLPEHEKRILAAELNMARRQMTDAQKVMVGRQIEPDIAERARRRMAEAGAKAAPGKPATDVAPIEAKRTTDEVARTVSLGSGRTYERHKQVIEAVERQPDGEQLIQHIESGDWDIPDAKKELESRGVNWRQPANVVTMPSPIDRMIAGGETANLEAFGEQILQAQLPTMVEEVVLGAAQHLLRAIRSAIRELNRLDWDIVTDEMRASETVLKHLGYIDRDLADLDAALRPVRLPVAAFRRVK